MSKKPGGIVGKARFACGSQPCDDITLVVLKRTEA